MTEGELKNRVSLQTYSRETIDSEAVRQLLDEAKKECPMLQKETGSSYGDIFTPEALTAKQVKLIMDTFRWIIKLFGE